METTQHPATRRSHRVFVLMGLCMMTWFAVVTIAWFSGAGRPLGEDGLFLAMLCGVAIDAHLSRRSRREVGTTRQ